MAASDREVLILDSYARQSVARKTSGSRLDLSIPGQHDVNLKTIASYRAKDGRRARLGLKLQDGKSAWNPKVIRDDWNILVGRLESGESNGVAIFDIERFIRQMEDAVRIVKLAEKGIVILDSDGEYDLTTPQGIKNFYEAAVAAKYYSDRLSTRAKRGLNMRTKEGLRNPGRYRSFGFEPDATTIRWKEAKHIRFLVGKILDAESSWNWMDCCKYFNDKKILTTNNGEWRRSTVRNMILSSRNAGFIETRGEIVGKVPGESIITEKQYHELHAITQLRRGRRTNPHIKLALATGRVACHNCKPNVVYADGTRPSIGSQPAQNGRFYDDDDNKPMQKYMCRRSRFFPNACARSIGDVREVDRALKDYVIARLADPKHAKQMQQLADRIRKATMPHEQELIRLKKLVDHWDQKLNNGDISIARHDALTDDLSRRIKAEEEALERVSVDVKVPPAAAAQDLLAEWDNPNTTDVQRREMFDQAFQGYVVSIEPGTIRDDARQIAKRIHVTPLDDWNKEASPFQEVSRR